MSNYWVDERNTNIPRIREWVRNDPEGGVLHYHRETELCFGKKHERFGGAHEPIDVSPQRLVREFHEKFGHPVRKDPVASIEERHLREDMLREEVAEYLDASSLRDVVGIAQELADVVYVAYGTALAHGIDLDRVIAEVHRANMTKTPAPPGEKSRKGPGFVPADVRRALWSK